MASVRGMLQIKGRRRTRKKTGKAFKEKNQPKQTFVIYYFQSHAVNHILYKLPLGVLNPFL